MDTLTCGFLCSVGPMLDDLYHFISEPWFLISSFLFSLIACGVCYIRREKTKVLRGGWSWLFIAGIDQSACCTALRPAISKAASQPVKLSTQPAQPHPILASLRSQAVRIIRNICSDVGFIPYFVQHSTGSYRSGDDGSFTIRIEKDTKLPASHDPLKENSCLVCVDDDYFCDMERELPRTWPQPWIMYSAQPRRAGGTVDGGSYYFDDNSWFNFVAAAGGTYKHPLWDWSNDHVTIIHKGVKYIYAVDRFFIPDNHTHALIMLLPVSKVDVWFRLYPLELYFPYYFDMVFKKWRRTPALEDAKDLLPSTTLLKRFNPVVKGVKANYTVFRVQSKKGDSKVTIGITNNAGSIRISEEKYSLARNIVVSASSVVTTSSFVTIGLTTEQALVLNAYARNVTFGELSLIPVRPIVVFTRQANMGEEVVPTMSVISPPLVSGMTFCPTDDQAAMQNAVKSRLKAFDTERDLNNHLRTELDNFFWLISRELGLEPHTLYPLDEDTYLGFLDGTKLGQNIRAFNNELSEVATSFVKKEAYPKINDERPILNYSLSHNSQLGRFSKALAINVLKKLSWYGFCDPATLGERLVNTATKAKAYNMDLYEADGHRFDGHVNELQRIIERKFFLFFLHPSQHRTFIALHDDDREIKVRGTFGFTWDLQNERGSGSAITSDGNSLISAFMSYYRFRLGRKVLEPEVAYSLIGVIGGDDTVVPSTEYFAENYKKAANKIGHEMEVKKCPPDRVSAFGRIYYGLFNGSKNSSSDPSRVLVKLHVTAGPIKDEEERKLRLEQKALSLWFTDRETPILGDYCEFILKHSRYRDVLVMDDKAVGKTLKLVFSKQKDLSNGIYFAVHDEATRFVNECEPAMEEVWNLECYNFELDKFNHWIRTAKTTEEFFKAGPFGRVQTEMLALDQTLDAVHRDNVVPKPKIRQRRKKRDPIIAEKLAEEMEQVVEDNKVTPQPPVGLKSVAPKKNKARFNIIPFEDLVIDPRIEIPKEKGD